MNVWIVVLIFVIIAVIIILILWAFWPSVTGQKVSGSSRTITTGFLGSCGGNVICESDLTCVSGVCLKDNGQPCFTSSDCAPPSNCLGATSLSPGVCSTAESGTLNGPCPCTNDLNLTCDNSFGTGNGVCKISTGSSGCGTNNDCLGTAVCITGVCQPRKLLGEKCVPGQCVSNSVCNVGDCTSDSQGYCQPVNVQTCDVGAFCNIYDMPGCNKGLMCDTTTNTCQSGTVGFNGACDDDSNFCISGLYCNNNGNCVFQQPPNDCSGNQGCPAGQKCINGECAVNTGDMCEVNNNCNSTTCNSGLSNISVWNVNTLNWDHYATNPMAGIKFNRITATTSISVDTLWGLDFSNRPTMGGLWKLVNPLAGHWIKTFDGTTRNVVTDSMNDTQTTTIGTIISIATDRSNIYVLIKITVDIMDMSNSDNDTTTTSWGIFKVGLNSSNQAIFTPVTNANPPQVGSDDIVNIVDFDVNAGGDILVVGNTDLSNVTDNEIYSLPSGDTSFAEVQIDDKPDSFKQVRFYYVENATGSSIVNSMDVAYVSGDDPNNEQLQFSGVLESVIYPVGKKNNYTIIDFGLSDLTANITSISPINIDSLWLIAPNPSSRDTGFYQILGGPQFSIPGYVGDQSLLLVTNNRTYSQSSGVCN